MRAHIYFSCGYRLPRPYCPRVVDSASPGGLPPGAPRSGGDLPPRTPLPDPLLAVGVTWAFAAGDAPAAAGAGRRRATHLDAAHRTVAEFVVEPPHEHRREQPHLSRPGG